VVLPTGEVLHVKRGDPIPADWPVPAWHEPRLKTAAGYSPSHSLLDLFIGSEGTLGVITRATVRTIPLPADVIGLLAFFPDRPAAVRFMVAARAAQRLDPEGALSPRCIEYYDSNCLLRAASRTTIPAGAGAALFCEQEVGEAGVDHHLGAWLEALGEAGALVDDTILAVDEPSRTRLLSMRHAIPAGINEEVVRNGMPKVGTDLAVPDEALDEMMTAYESCPLPFALFGHLGDNHLHLNVLPRSATELSEARAYYDGLARRAVALGGTISAEHGVGKLKRDHLAWMVGEPVLGQFRALKQKLDPNGILGRGNVFRSGSL
jgi:D-lactate dehydrogenase (cytochrome)